MNTANSGSNIVKYRKHRNINFLMIVFVLILIYLASQVYSMSRQATVNVFVVENAQEAEEIHEYRGLICRDEEVILSGSSGYINYYVREGKRAPVDSLICTIDPEGTFSRQLSAENQDASALSDSALTDLKSKLTEISLSVKSGGYSSISDFKAELDATVTEAFLYSAAGELGDSEEEIKQKGLKLVKTVQSGFILFRTDTLDGILPEDVTAESFVESRNRTTVYSSGNYVEKGDFAYKWIEDDSFSIIFPITEEDAKAYKDKKYLKVELVSLGVSVNGAFRIFTSEDGITLGEVDLTKYGSSFLESRYLDFCITENSSKGYKIPVSSVTTKEFFLIPKDFMEKDDNGNILGVHVEGYSSGKTNEDGSPAENDDVVSVSVYSSTDDYYYVYSKNLKLGDYLIHPKTDARYLVSVTAALDGVYNVNKGYCIFRQVQIIKETTDHNYYLVETGTNFGISVYDRIVLDASLVKENQIIQ